MSLKALGKSFLPIIAVVVLGAAALTHRAAAGTVYENYTFTTLAGPAAAGSGWHDGSGGAARFDLPGGAAVDRDGNVYVADSQNHTIRKITPDGRVTTLAGWAGTSGSADGTGSVARFDAPQSVAVDGSGNVYVADAYNHTIRRVTPAGVVTTLAGKAGTEGTANGTGAAARFSYPYGVAVSGNGTVFVSEFGNHTIRKITPGGAVTTLAGQAGTAGSANGTGGSARFYSPAGLAVDASNTVYVADTFNHTIRKITPSGVVTTWAGLAGSSGSTNGTSSSARFYYPSGVAVDGSNNVYVADTYNHSIRMVTRAGVVTKLAGSTKAGSADGTGSSAAFDYPMGVAVDRSNQVYVADTYNSTIRKVTLAGVVTTLAGKAGGPGSADGTGSAARFNYPAGVASDEGGTVYVADFANHLIRKITAEGEVTTLAGSTNAGSADGTGSGARFNNPCGVAVDRSNNVYVAEYGNNMIRKITPEGVVTTLAGSTNAGSADGMGSAAGFHSPFALAVDSDANIIVGDTLNNMIRRITPEGVVTTLAGSTNAGSADGVGPAARFHYPEGVAMDSSNNVYVADDGNTMIRKISPGRAVTTLAGSTNSGSADGTGAAASFSHVFGAAVDRSGNVYVADSGNNTIRKVTPAGVVTTLAGAAPTSGNEDGTGSEAAFSMPEGVAVDGNGNVYVADAYNHSIRKGSPAPPDSPVVDVPVGQPGIIRHLDITNRTTTSWSWDFIRYPAGSTAQLSTTNSPNPTLLPDVPDFYVVRFRGRDDSGRLAIGTVVIGVDSTAPTLAILKPTPAQRWSNSVFTVSGRARDDVEVASVWYQVNDGTWNQATGTVTWTASASLAPGTNVIRAYAKDTAGNVSATNSVRLVYALNVPLVVQMIGRGTLSPNYNGQALEIGKTYKMTAKPALGFAFREWTGGVPTNSPTITFVMQSNLTLVASFRDTVKPTLVITAPKASQIWSNAVFPVAGTAKDNVGVAGVWWQINTNAWMPATGTSNWTAGAPLASGANTLRAYAIDADGNMSAANSVKFTYVVSDRLALSITGQGTVTPNYSNAVLAIGKVYTMTAQPKTGYVFSNWSGSVLATTSVLKFTMQSNLVLQANFIPNPFVGAKGKYAGLFYDTNSVTPTNAGLFTATLTDRGSFSSSLKLASASYSLSGQLSVGGAFSNSIARTGQRPLSVQLQADLSSRDSMAGTVGDGLWMAALTANRAVYSSTNPAPQGGQKYTVAIDRGSGDPTQPSGYGVGAAKVDVSGNLAFSGTLGDGTPVTPSTFVSRQGQWPFYSSLYAGKGMMLGWLTFTTNEPEVDLRGLVYWVKLPQPGTKLYPLGFAFTSGLEAAGSVYTFTNGVPVLNMTNGVAVFEGGNLSDSLTNQVTLGTNNRVTSTNKMSLTITTSSGLFQGGFIEPVTGRSNSVRGALLQRGNAGFGNFLGTNQSGSVFLGPE